MKVLLVGGFNDFTKAIAAKLSKNGINTAIMNEEETKLKIRAQYTKYTSKAQNLGRVLENYRPDILLYTSFFDPTYSLGHLESVVSQSATFGVRRFILLSSTQVYGLQSLDGYLPSETDNVAPVGKYAIAFSAAEELCRSWEKVSDLQVTVLRLANVYGPGMDDCLLHNWIHHLLDDQVLELREATRYNFLHLDDATEAILQVVYAGFSPTYNVVSDETLLPSQFLHLLTTCPSLGEVDIELALGYGTECVAVSNALLRREYDWHEHHRLTDELPNVVGAIKEQRLRQQKSEQRREQREQRLFGNHFSFIAAAETALLFAFAVFLTKMQGILPLIDDTNFIYLFLVLIALSMNLQQSALALLMACGFLVYQQAQQGYDLFTAIINARTLLKAAEFCLVGVAVSYVIHRLRENVQNLNLEKIDLQDELNTMRQFSEDNLRTRHFFEDQILEYETSLPRIISLTARLDTLEPERIIPETMNVLAEVLGAEDVAAYVIGSRGGRMRLSFARTHAARAMGQSPLLEEYDQMVEALKNDRIFINRSLHPAYPTMASGVKINDKLAFVFVFWHMPFRKLGLDTSNLLQAITRMVGAAVHRAWRYEEMTYAERYLPYGNILRHEAFSKICKARGVGAIGSSDVLCRILAHNISLQQLGLQLKALLRENDYLGEGGDGSLLLLLPSTGLEGYRSFQSRLAERGLNCETGETVMVR